MSQPNLARQIDSSSSPRLVRIVETDAHEGPVYVAHEDALYFTSRNGAIKRLVLESESVSAVSADVNRANGMTLGLDGCLVVCEQGTASKPARISRIDPATGAAATIVSDWRGFRFNSPNDVAVRSDGSIWFTDPAYGYLQGFRPQPELGDYVYRHHPDTGTTSVVADSFDKPNGIAFSPDEQVLYVTDSGANQEEGSYYVDRPHHVKAFNVCDGRRLVNERLFCVVTPGFPDGIKCDSEGRVYVSCFEGVQIFDAGGEEIGAIELPGAVNFTFGGPDRNVLFITTDEAIWAAAPDATGPERRSGKPNLRGA
jgi:gluconolactonase